MANGNAHATDGGEVFSSSNLNGELRKKRILVIADDFAMRDNSGEVSLVRRPRFRMDEERREKIEDAVTGVLVQQNAM